MKKTKKLAFAKETVRTMAAVQGGTFSLSDCYEVSGGHTCSCHNSNYVDCWQPAVDSRGC
jgi:hypothetical protein